MVAFRAGSAAASGSRFAFVDCLRGIASLLVAWHHIVLWGSLTEPAQAALPRFALTIAENGMYGVQMFFVISGFVIAYSIRGARITPGYLGNFALRRSLRLDPPYWAAIAIVLGLHFVGWLSGLLPSPMNAPPQAKQVFAHFVYLQDILDYENLSLGFWTLCIEVQFYLLLVMGVGIAQRLPGSQLKSGASGANLLFVFGPLALVSLFIWHPNHAYDPWVVRYFGIFFFGSLIWWTLERRLPMAVLAVYGLAMLVRLYFAFDRGVLTALVTGTLIAGLGSLGWLHIGENQPWLKFLGRISYSLYLVHYPISHVTENLGLALTGSSPLSTLCWLLISLAASIAGAYGLFLLVEAPSVRWAAYWKPAEKPEPTKQMAYEPAAELASAR